MSAHLCIVSGTLVAPDGSPMPDVNVRFLPAPVAMRAVDSRILAPRPVTVTADAEARISVQLAPGVYSVRTREAAGREYDPYLIEVPARETAELSEIVIPLQAPQSVYDAAASARQAALSAGEVQAVLDQIQGLEGTDLAALAQLVEEVQGFIPETGADGEVLTLTAGAPAWRPAPGGAVASVNGQTGAVVLSATGLGAATAAQGARADSALQPGAQIPWADITGAPALAAVAVSGRYDDLANRPALFDGTWDSLAGRPANFQPAGHGHGMAEIDGLQAALDTKADAAAIGDIQAILESI